MEDIERLDKRHFPRICDFPGKSKNSIRRPPIYQSKNILHGFIGFGITFTTIYAKKTEHSY